MYHLDLLLKTANILGDYDMTAVATAEINLFHLIFKSVFAFSFVKIVIWEKQLLIARIFYLIYH